MTRAAFYDIQFGKCPADMAGLAKVTDGEKTVIASAPKEGLGRADALREGRKNTVQKGEHHGKQIIG